MNDLKTTNLDIQLLFSPGWGAAEDVRLRVNSVLERKGIEARVAEKTVDSNEEAVSLRFPGSPTVRVNGRDVEPQAELQENYGLGWRLYQDEAGGLVKEIPESMLESAVEEALG